jgi:hypothetical protein
MTNEEFVRRAYGLAEVKDIAGWIDCFNPDSVFVDESVAVTSTGHDEVAFPVENYGLGVLGNLDAVLEPHEARSA